MYQQQLSIFEQLESNKPKKIETSVKGKKILSLDGEAIFYPQFFTIEESDQFFQALNINTN
jgi:hypothetical protein